MDGDMMSILNNIVSLLNELKQMETAEQGQESNEVQEELAQAGDELQPKNKVAMAEKDEEEKDKEIKKALEETPSEGATANDDAEDRVEDPDTTINEDTIDEVAKAMVKLLQGKNVVKKSENSGSKELKIITKVVKSLSDRVIEQDKAITNILKGIGIADEITKSTKVDNNSQVRKGLNDTKDINESLAYIMKHINKDAEVKKSYGTPAEEARSIISKNLKHLVTGK